MTLSQSQQKWLFFIGLAVFITVNVLARARVARAGWRSAL